MEVLNTLMKKHMPQRNVKQNCKLPWVNNGIRRRMRRRKRARAKSKKTGKVADLNQFKGMYKDLKKQLRAAHTEYLTNIFADDDDRLSKNAWAKKVRPQAVETSGEWKRSSECLAGAGYLKLEL